MTQPPPYGAPAGPPAKDNTQLFGILSIVLAFCCSPLGIVFGILSMNSAKKVGGSQTLGQIGTGLSVLFFIGGIIYQVAIR